MYIRPREQRPVHPEGLASVPVIWTQSHAPAHKTLQTCVQLAQPRTAREGGRGLARCGGRTPRNSELHHSRACDVEKVPEHDSPGATRSEDWEAQPPLTTGTGFISVVICKRKRCWEWRSFRSGLRPGRACSRRPARSQASQGDGAASGRGLLEKAFGRGCCCSLRMGLGEAERVVSRRRLLLTCLPSPTPSGGRHLDRLDQVTWTVCVRRKGQPRCAGRGSRRRGRADPEDGNAARCPWGDAGPPGPAGEKSLWWKGKYLQVTWGRAPRRSAGSSRKGNPRGGEGPGREHRGGSQPHGEVVPTESKDWGPEEAPQNR